MSILVDRDLYCSPLLLLLLKDGVLFANDDSFVERRKSFYPIYEYSSHIYRKWSLLMSFVDFLVVLYEVFYLVDAILTPEVHDFLIKLL